MNQEGEERELISTCYAFHTLNNPRKQALSLDKEPESQKVLSHLFQITHS